MTRTLTVPFHSHELRSQLLFGIAIWLATFAGGSRAAEETPHLEVTGRRTFVATPRRGVNLKAYAYYTHAEGVEMLCRYAYQSRSDVLDTAFHMRSTDNGRTWSEPVEVPTQRRVPDGVIRSNERPGFVDPTNDVLVVFGGNSLLPTGNPLETMTRGRPEYKLSRDGGRTFFHEGPVIHVGDEFDEAHPLPGVWVGKNAVQVGDLGCRLIKIRTGELLQPVQITPLGPDGKYYKPGGGYTYHDSAVLIGTWNAQSTLDWRMSKLVVGDPKQTTRGMLEPTVAEMPDGRLLMVMRGSNDANPKLKGYRWHSVSADGGKTWSEPTPWKYATGESFFSPSSCSTLIRHSSGEIVWIGNIAPTNPRGNNPRFPLAAGLIDPASLQLIRESVVEIDTRRDDDHPQTTFSNFYVDEDRESHELVIYCPVIGRHHPLSKNNLKTSREWTADTTEYRVAVKR